MMSGIKTIVLCFAALLALLSWQFAYGAEGIKRALLIGVNKYQVLPWLSGSTNDVEIMRQILLSRFGFVDENITVLLDEEATRANIISALETFVSSADPNDIVYIHYSGHGSQVDDQDGDEDDNLDETICPQDARTPGVPDITDDDLKRILGKLNVLSALVVLDSCHSGTALRSAASDIRSRSVPRDTRIDLYKPDQTTTRGVVPLDGDEPYVLFSAAAANQEELDGPFGADGQPLGLLTATLSRALQSSKSDASPRDLLTEVEREVNKLKPIFAGHPVPVAQLEGQLHLIEMPLFSPDPNAKLQRLTLPKAKPEEEQTTRRFFVHGDDKKLLKRSLGNFVDTEIEWVDDASAADVVFDCTSQSACDVFGPNGIVRVARLQDDQPLTNGENPSNVVARIAEVATTARSVAELLSINDQDGAIRLQMNAVGQPATGQQAYGTRGIKLTASVSDHHIRFYSPADNRTFLNSLQLSVSTDTQCYLTLVSVDSAGTVTQLLPNPLQVQAGFLSDGLIRPQQTVLIPDALDETNRAGFYMDYAPPAGTDTIRAFCSAELGTARSLRDAVSRIAAGEADVSLAQALITGRGLTGLSPDQSTSSSLWGATTLTVQISSN